MELSPEERARIVEEERVRLQVRAELEAELRGEFPAVQGSPSASAERAQLGIPLAFGGATFLIVGLGALFYFAWVFSVAVPVEIPPPLQPFATGAPTSVNNVGLLADRQNGMIVGSVLALLGAASLLTGLVLSAGQRRNGLAGYSVGLVAVATGVLFAANQGVTGKDVSRGLSRAVGNASVDDPEAKERLKKVGIGMLMYVTDNQRYPDMTSPVGAQVALLPYMMAKDPAIFVDPISGKPWAFNERLSGFKEVDSKYAASVIVAYSPEAGPDGSRFCLYADSHCTKLSKARWETAVATKKIEIDESMSYSSSEDSTLTPQ